MDEQAASLASAIGDRVRHERAARGWTLDQLAAAAGVSRRMLVNVEQGAANPSVGTLLRLSDALGVGLPALVEPPQPTSSAVIRAGEAPVLWRGDGGGRASLMAGTRPPDVVELWDWELAPGDEHASEAHSPGTQELIHVLAGRVDLVVGAERISLSTGDAVSFPGDVPHQYANIAAAPARFALAVFQPSVGVPRRTADR